MVVEEAWWHSRVLAADAHIVEVSAEVEDALVERTAGRVAVVLDGKVRVECSGRRVERGQVERAFVPVDLPEPAARVHLVRGRIGDERVDALCLDRGA